MPQSQSLIIKNTQAGQRLDRFLAENWPEKSRAAWQKMIKNDQVRVNTRETAADYIIKNGDRISFTEAQVSDQESNKKASAVIPEVPIIYENEDIIVMNKPAGITVHAATSNRAPLLTNFLQAHFPPIAQVGENEQKFGLVHRLDKDTSGVIIAAKNQNAFAFLKNEFKTHRAQKKYLCLVHGVIHPAQGEIRTLIGRSKTNPTKQQAYLNPQTAPPNARKAVSAYRTLKTLQDQFSFLEVQIQTGRMHQIRVHLKHLGHPVVGDSKYSFKNQTLKTTENPGMFLHATALTLTLPDGTISTFTAPLPNNLQEFLKKHTNLD